MAIEIKSFEDLNNAIAKGKVAFFTLSHDGLFGECNALQYNIYGDGLNNPHTGEIVIYDYPRNVECIPMNINKSILEHEISKIYNVPAKLRAQNENSFWMEVIQ